MATFDRPPELAKNFLKKEWRTVMTENMEMDIGKSEDELELERLVFGDTGGIKERLSGKKDPEKKAHTDLEHLENDQVRAPPW
jgi:hypothetical protein